MVPNQKSAGGWKVVLDLYEGRPPSLPRLAPGGWHQHLSMTLLFIFDDLILHLSLELHLLQTLNENRGGCGIIAFQ